MHHASPARSPGDGPQRVVVVRVPVTPGWVGTLPPAPADRTVSVSLTDPRSAMREAAGLRALGYVALGLVSGGAQRGDWADFGLAAESLARHPSWIEVLVRTKGGRLLDPALGPARLALGPVAQAHESISPRTPEASATTTRPRPATPTACPRHAAPEGPPGPPRGPSA